MLSAGYAMFGPGGGLNHDRDGGRINRKGDLRT